MKQYEGLFILDTQDSAEGVDAIIQALGELISTLAVVDEDVVRAVGVVRDEVRGA